MIVTKDGLQTVLEYLAQQRKLAVDVESSGLHPYQKDVLVGISFYANERGFYFICPSGTGQDSLALTREELLRLNHIFDNPLKTIFQHNSKFDLAFLTNFGFNVTAKIHCTKAIGRLIYNDHLKYSLDATAERDLKERKSNAVEDYIKKHKLWEWQTVPGKKGRTKNKFFSKVPTDILALYAIKDAELTYRIGVLQERQLDDIARKNPPTLPNIRAVRENEVALTRTVFDIERLGIRIDADFCRRSIRTLAATQSKAALAFEQSTGRKFIDSAKSFTEIFEGDRKSWGMTKKGNPSFSSKFLENFKHPGAKYVLEYRDAKSKANFLHGFLYFMDENNCVHPTFDPAGTVTGRFSSSDPNFQNLERIPEEDDIPLQGIKIREAIIPREDFVFVSLDYKAQEYRLLIDYAQEKELIQKILEGLDVHQATAEMMGVNRTTAKTINFMLLYGGGAGKLAQSLGIDFKEANRLKNLYFERLPRVAHFIQHVINTAKIRGWIFNWFGRIYHFKDPKFAYRAPNAIVQGGCADVGKIAMNRIAAFLANRKSHMILQVHDEIVLEVHKTELKDVPLEVKRIMESVYPYKKLPLTVDVKHSWKNLAEMKKGWPNG